MKHHNQIFKVKKTDLEDCEEKSKEGVDVSDRPNTVHVDYVGGQVDNKIKSCTSTKHCSPLPEKSTSMRLFMPVRVWWLDQVQQQVD